MSSFVSGQNHFDEPIYLISERTTYFEAVHCAFKYLSKSKNIFTKQERQYPEMFEYLGWRSWDAMRTDVNEEGIKNKASEFINKNIPVRRMLIDDGWFPGQDGMIKGFLPDPKKFPNSFKPMIEEIKSKSNIKWFGVWHALPGYWNGVVPESSLAQQESKYLYETQGGYLVPSPENGSRFYYHWNEILRKEGINFLKVDGQSSVGKCFKGSLSICESARCMNRELELGACLMNDNIINCMGMAMENILGRPTSGISRNSDDFITDHKGFVEHLLQNAYNSIYHDEIYHCDWDMFWTKHEHAVMHSMLRAISGGPIYFSDKVGDTIPKILEPLVYSDGRILRMDRSAKPTENCLFVNPLENGVLKLHNVTSWGSSKKGGIISAHNITNKVQKVSFKSNDIPDLEHCESYWVSYDYLKKKVQSLKKTETFNDEIEPNNFGWYIILPEIEKCTCFGLLDKYVCFKSVENIQNDGKTQVNIIHETGYVGWATKNTAKKVTINGIDVTSEVKQNGDFYTINHQQSKSKEVLILEW